MGKTQFWKKNIVNYVKDGRQQISPEFGQHKS